MVFVPWESFFSANNAPTKNFLFISHPNFISFGLFLCPWYLERPKGVSGDVSGETNSIGRFQKNICISSKYRLFWKGLVHGFWSKMTKFSGRQSSLFYVPRDLGVWYLSLGNRFLVQITPQRRIFCLSLTLSSSLLDYFYVSGPLRSLKSVSEDVLGHTDSIGSF